MKQISSLFLSLCLVSSAVAAPKTADRSPFEIEIENQCSAAMSLQLGEWKGEVQAGQKTEVISIASTADDWAYNLLSGDKDLALLSFQPAGRYALVLSHCAADNADVLTTDLAPKPAALDENKAPEVRFRARQTGLFLEYQVGKGGRFMPLSIAMTSFKETPAGAFEFTIRARSAKNGPVFKTLKKSLQFAPGHRYLIEASLVQNELFFKAEDEGWIK